MLNDVTIVVPCFNNRHRYLERILSYYRGANIPVVVCDSSQKAFPNRKKYNAKYIHYKDMEYKKKLWKCIKSIKTKYVVMCGDDDFITISGVKMGIDFLEKNKDYSSVQGQNMLYFFMNSEVHYSLTPYHLRSVENKKASERLENLPGYEIFYALHRTKNLKKALKCGTKIKYDNTLEYALLFTTFINGKNKVLRAIFSIKEYAMGEKQHNTVTIPDIKKNCKTEYKKLVDFLSEQLSKKERISMELAKEKVRKAIDYHFTGMQETKHNLLRLIRQSAIRLFVNAVDALSKHTAILIKRTYGIHQLRKYELLYENVKKKFPENYYEIKKIDALIKKYSKGSS